jgi:hypothetical protein
LIRIVNGENPQSETKDSLYLSGLPNGKVLCELIAGEAHAGRSHWRTRSLFVPHLDKHAAGSTKGLLRLSTLSTSMMHGVQYGPEKTRKTIHNTVIAELAQQAPLPANWTRSERVQLRQLHITALLDLRDIGRDRLDEWDERNLTTINRDLREGRGMWAALGGFPWLLYGPTGKPSEHWRTDELAIAAWSYWMQ